MESNIILSQIPISELLAQFQAIIKQEVAAALDHREGERMLDVAEAVKIFNPAISRQSLSNWTKQGLIPMTKIGHKNFYKLSDIVSAGTRLKKYKAVKQ